LPGIDGLFEVLDGSTFGERTWVKGKMKIIVDKIPATVFTIQSGFVEVLN
jgi:hypothetical protein